MKGPPRGHVLDIESIARPVWERATGAWQVNVAELASPGGAVQYLTVNLALEKGKGRQAPTELPSKTRTLRATRGYWSVDPAELRRRAVNHQAARRLQWWLIQEGYSGDLLELAFAFEWELRQQRTWELWEVRERQDSALFEPVKRLERVAGRCSRRFRAPLGSR